MSGTDAAGRGVMKWNWVLENGGARSGSGIAY
jgi:hypothetical protein